MNSSSPPIPSVLKPIRKTGEITLSFLKTLGSPVVFLSHSLSLFLIPPIRLRETIRQIHFIGVKSLSVILLTSIFTGMVLALQGYYTLRKVGSEGVLGALVALSLIRELGPVLCALMVTGRAGSAMTAELGVMKISEQLDAIYTMGLNPLRQVVNPKMLATLISVPILTGIFDFVGILGGYLVGVLLLGVNEGAFFTHMKENVVFHDLFTGFIKSISFGIIIAWICCYKGYNTEKGAEGVGKATTEAVVLSSILVLVWDYMVTSFML